MNLGEHVKALAVLGFKKDGGGPTGSFTTLRVALQEGGVYTVPDGVERLINAAPFSISATTVKFPLAPADGCALFISSGYAVGRINLKGNGHPLVGPNIIVLAQNTGVLFRFDAIVGWAPESYSQIVWGNPVAHPLSGTTDVVADLFLALEQGVWFDSSDLSTMFQDSAGTVPVTAVGQPIGKWLDKSGNFHHAVQVTPANRPILAMDDTGHYYVAFAGTTYLVTNTVDFTGVAQMSGFASVRRSVFAASADNNSIIALGAGDNTGELELAYFGNRPLLYRRGNGDIGATEASATVNNQPVLLSFGIDLPQVTALTEVPYFRVNQQDSRFGTVYGAADTGGGNFRAAALTVGNGLTGRLYGLILRGAASDAAQVADAESYLISKSFYFAGSLDYVFNPVLQFADTGTPLNMGTHFQTSPFASVDVQTEATVLECCAISSIHGSYPKEAEVGVYVNGQYVQSIIAQADGEFADRVYLGAGSKVVSFVNGAQTKPSATVLGTFIVTVAANAPFAQTNLIPANRILVYGDSISVGGNADILTAQAWAMKVRTAYAPNSLAVEGWGFRTLFEDAQDVAARSAFVARINSYAPARIWLAIGTNDYALSKWSAASFGAAYAAVLDGIHAAMPGATVFCQSPLLRAIETANAHGSTLGDYRNQIQSAAGARATFCTFVDGTQLLTLGDLADGLHPTTAGHDKYALAVQSVLSI